MAPENPGGGKGTECFPAAAAMNFQRLIAIDDSQLMVVDVFLTPKDPRDVS